MKKLINLITLVMLVSINVLTPFSYADVLSGDSLECNSGYVLNDAGTDCEKNEFKVQFDANGGDLTPAPIIVEKNTSINLPDVNRNKYSFLGWYTSANGGERVGGYNSNYTVTEDITLYAQREICPNGYIVIDNKCINGVTYKNNIVKYIDAEGNEFDMGTITASNGENTITLLDRNLGATATGGTDAYGYHFQWGNNYGFDRQKNIKTESSQINAENYGWSNPYSSNLFIKNSNSNRDSSNNPNLWGGIYQGGDSIGYKMQGPCPVGYHVPTINEWSTLLKIYHDIDSRGSSLEGNYPSYEVIDLAFRKGFQNTFYIALAGLRNNNAELENQGTAARFWTSTPSNSNTDESRRFYLDRDRVDSSGSKKQRINGYSIRCFADTDYSDVVVLSFDTRGGTQIQSRTLPKGGTLEGTQNTTKSGDIFIGWYLDKDLTEPYNSDPINNDTVLYAKWRNDLITHEDNVILYTDTQGKIFNMGTFTINIDGNTITLLDRNLGAISTEGEDAYGYYFQWGNNYGFPWYNTIETDGNIVDASGYVRNNPYVNNKFIIGNSYWDASSNPDLWGDNTNTQPARQGPCPAGYHIPTVNEWQNLINLYNEFYSNFNIGNQTFKELFQDSFKIPLAGRIRYSNGKIENLGNNARIWASDSNVNYAGRFYLGGTTVDAKINSEKGYGYQIRCFKDEENSDTIILSYNVNGGTEIQSQTLIKGDTGYLPGYTTTKIGDNLIGWYKDELMTEPFDFDEPITQDTTIHAKWSLSHMVIFKDGDGNILKKEIVNHGDNVVAPTAPQKNGYSFIGWDKPLDNITQDVEITAQYEKIKGGSSGGGGGGGGGAKMDEDKAHDSAPNEDIKNQESRTKDQDKQPKEEEKNNIVPKSTSEFDEAYNFAYRNGITTMPTIQKANMNGKLTRIAMAKMLSNYAVNVLGKEPDTTQTTKFNDVSDKKDADYDNGVTLAYQLGIMGQNMPGNNFRPNDEVTRAEFATALSRLLYGTSDGEYKSTSKYYIHHMEKLKNKGIITKDNPNMKELRSYVMIILMRSTK